MTIRLFSSALLGVLISLALYWLMSSMVMDSGRGLGQTSPTKMVEFVRLKRETAPQTEQRRQPPPKPKTVDRPPPLAMTAAQARTPSPAELPAYDIPNLDIPLRLDRFGASALTGIGVDVGPGPATSGEIIPLVRIAPKYPMRAQMRRIEGWVKVLFVITETGAVRDVEVIESQPAGVFDRAAVDAIEKWKFKPKEVSGEAVPQRAAQVLEFKLNK